MKTIPRRHGFTLVEMSIVVIILGLLVGSILSGRALMRASELNSIAVSYQVYKNAVKSFRVQYYSLPGDMANATSIWGYTGGAGCTNSSGTASTSPGTCDGDGDGFIEYGATASRAGEAFQGWRQLALGSFIDGSYTGIAGTPADGTYGAVKYDIGTNGPNSKIDLVGWSLSYFDNSAGGTAAMDAG